MAGAAIRTGGSPAIVSGGPMNTDGMRWPTEYPMAGPPDRAALVFRDDVLTFAQVDRLAASTAALLIRLGCGRGERVAYLGRNSAIYFPILLGAARSGTVMVPLNWRCTASELSFIIHDAGVTMILCDADLEDLARASGAEVAIRTLEGPDGFRAAVEAEPALINWTTEPDAPWLLMFTSGTTGRPKGVVLTQRMFALGRQAEITSSDYANWRDDDVVLSPMPNFHMAACCWVQCAIMRGMTCVITDDPSPANLLALIPRHGVTHTFIVPTVIRALLDLMEAEDAALPTLREVHYGAAPMDTVLVERAMRIIGCGFLQHYGMTENAGTATRLAPRDHDLARPHLLRSVGRPQPGMEVAIRRPDQSIANRGEAGEIWLKSPTLMSAYRHNPQATQEAIVDGWYRSGDGGYIDDDGYLFLTDRIKDMIVSGGENVYPVEVEAVLRAHATVADVAVFGLPDDRWGEIVIAAVECVAGIVPDADALRAHARAHLAGYKVPKRIIFDLPLPRTASGKLQRAAARLTLLQQQTSQGLTLY